MSMEATQDVRFSKSLARHYSEVRNRLWPTVIKLTPEAEEMPVITEDLRRELYTEAFQECLKIMREALGDAGMVIAREMVTKAEAEEAIPQDKKMVRIIDVLRAVAAYYSIS